MNKMMLNGSNNKNEEFSFPVICNNPSSSSSSSSSSSLWRISSRVYHQPEDYDYEDHKVGHPMEVRSMCEEILPNNYTRRDQEIDELVRFNNKQLEVEQSMDYLWEDFNDEENTDYINERKSIDGEMSVLKLNKITTTKPNNSISSRNKLVVIGKLLKGLISIRKSAQLKIFKVESKVFMRQA